MSELKTYIYNGWFGIDAATKDEAEKLAKQRIDYEIASPEGIIEKEILGGAWKKYDFKGWFIVSARSIKEALKRSISFINSKDPDVLLSDEEIENKVNIADFLTTNKLGKITAFHFLMSNGDHSKTAEVHAISAKEAWESMRSEFLYDEHVILSQEILLPTAISPKWRLLDASRDMRTPSRLSHQVVVAVGLAGESWWASYDNVFNTDEDAKLLESPDLPLSL